MKQIRFLSYWVGTKCTLHCKNCCNLIPYVKQKSFEPEKIIKNLKYICEYTKISCLQIQGGEPFTHPKIAQILESVLKIDTIEKIEIASNGTIMPNEETVKIIAAFPEKITVRFSNYSCVNEDRRRKIVNSLLNAGVKVALYDFMLGDGNWFDSGTANTEKNKDKEETFRNYKRCYNKSCWVLGDDYFACCGKIIALSEIKQENIESGNNVLNVTALRNGGADFEKCLESFDRHYQTAAPALCAYCVINDKEIPPAIQLSKSEIQNIQKGIYNG